LKITYMAKRKRLPEELTEKMHSEFQVSDDTEQKHATWAALDAIADGDMSRDDAMEEYGVSEEDFAKYTAEWEDIND
jgi:hypothetical protein